jgi:competence ComEA-like helix-hairpin-helix protein
MFRTLIIAALCAAPLAGAASVVVDINSVDETTLQTFNGIGASKAQSILRERVAHGPFRSADDLQQRVKGLGLRSIAKWQHDGLTFGGANSGASPHAFLGANSRASTHAFGGANSRASPQAFFGANSRASPHAVPAPGGAPKNTAGVNGSKPGAPGVTMVKK